MTPESLQSIGWIFIKLITLIGIGIYTLFAGIIVRQEQLMAHVLEEGTEPILRLLAIIHLLASIGILLAAIILL